MQGLADGYFVLPYTIGDYLAPRMNERVDTGHPAFARVEQEVAERVSRLLSIQGERTVDSIHRQLGRLMWDKCGMARTKEGLEEALAEIPRLREEFWTNVRILGDGEEINESLEKAGRVADFLELAELLCRDALHREESAGGHFREEHQTEEGEARRNDDDFSYVAAWEHTGPGEAPRLHKEELEFEHVRPSQRSYK
jgi:succinate dehydrogenase / fumarate reductase flavoprotein subunit